VGRGQKKKKKKTRKKKKKNPGKGGNSRGKGNVVEGSNPKKEGNAPADVRAIGRRGGGIFMGDKITSRGSSSNSFSFRCLYPRQKRRKRRRKREGPIVPAQGGYPSIGILKNAKKASSFNGTRQVSQERRVFWRRKKREKLFVSRKKVSSYLRKRSRTCRKKR